MAAPSLPTVASSPILDVDVSRESYANGASITQLSDWVGSRHFTSPGSASRPTMVTSAINGYPVARFDGVDDYMTQSSMLAQSLPYTVILVGKTRSATTNGQRMLAGGDYDHENSPLLRVLQPAATYVWSWSASGDTVKEDDEAVDANNHVWILTSTDLRIDGTVEDTMTAGAITMNVTP
jgi:hypothetical protein